MVKTRVLGLLTALSLVLGASVSSPVSAQADAEDQGWSSTADQIWDVTNPGAVRHTGTIRALVWDMEEHDGRMYVAGRFLEVKAPDGSTYSQPYLAAFDVDTGVWIESFAPSLDGVVYAIDFTDDGRLLAGGELTGGVVSLDAATGTRHSNFDAGVTNSWGPPAVFDVEVNGSDVYIGGTFSRSQGTALTDLAKLDATTGELDLGWLPTTMLDAGVTAGGRLVFGIAVDPGRDRVYLAGKFAGINGNEDAAYFATLDPEDGSLRSDVRQGLPANILSNLGDDVNRGWSMWMHDVQWRGDKVYIGGQGHQTTVLDAATLTAQSSWFTNRGVGDQWAGGDTQVIHLGENTIWSGCHCWGSVGDYPIGAFIADPGGVQTIAEYRDWVRDFREVGTYGQQDVKGMYGVDINTEELIPLTFDIGGIAGAYAIFEDSNGRVWFGGQFSRDPVTGRSIEGIARFSQEAEPVGPSGLRSPVQTRERVVMTWDRLSGATGYELLRDGAIVGTPTGNWFTDRSVEAGTTYSYEVRAIIDGVATPSSDQATVSTLGYSGPSGLRSALETRERIVLTWDRVAGATGYELLRDGTVVGSPTGNWFTDRDLEAGTAYTYEVRAVVNAGETPLSGPVVASTNP